MVTIAILLGVFGSQIAYAFITNAKTYNVKSNVIVEIHTGGGRLTQTKTRTNRDTSWVVLPNNDGVKSGINKTVGRTYTLQLKGNPAQLGTDSLDAKIDTEW